MSESSKDRRRFPRVPLNLLIQYRFDTFEDFISEYASDLSEGGMFIKNDDDDDTHEEGQLVYLQFTLKDGTRLIEGLGKIVRINDQRSGDPGLGIEFLNFDEDSKALIEAIVRERAEG
ncbi:MAG: PilZ domain-containing protein [Deltaproteobacteria bacterium]|nr:PilZ domain-containing protein [Deltaproteobacteria bacterium]